MFGQPRSKANTPAFEKGYAGIDWSDDGPATPGRSVRSKRSGGWDCGIKTHDHDTFKQAADCVAKEK